MSGKPVKTLRDKLTESGRAMSISTKYGLGVGLLLALIVTVAATGYFALHSVRSAEALIEAGAEIQRLVLEMDWGMEKARRLHGDFFLQYPRIGLSRAHEQYVQPSVRCIAQVISTSNALRDLLDRSAVSEALRTSRVDLNLFLSSSKRFAETSIESVELVTKLAAPEWGLEAQLEDWSRLLYAEIAGVEKLRQAADEMRSFAQDYRITRKRFVMQSAFNAAFSLRSRLAEEPTPAAARAAAINELLDAWMATAERILEVDVAIRSKFNDFALQTEAADGVSNALVKLAREEVSRARTRIVQAHRIAFLIMAVIALAGLIAAATIARVLNRSITQRVVSLNRSAEELRKGRLEVVVEEAGTDELSQLARTFNVMAARVRESIDTLEQQVQRRTAELAASERRFRGLFEHSGNGVVVLDACDEGRDFVIRDVNKAVEKIEGIKREEVLGRRITQVFPGIRDFGLLEVLSRVWRTGDPAVHPVHFYSDEKRCGWRENSLYRLPSGEVVAVYADLTAQVEAQTENKKMEARLRRAEKMETIGLLAGGVAHDLNNILSGIVGYPELLLLQLPEDSRLRAPIEAIRESGQRAAAVVADLLTLARGVAGAKTTADLNTLVADYLNSPEGRRIGALHEEVTCTTRFDPQARNILCSPIHVKKCVMNLVINAMEAIEGPGHIEIATRNAEVDERMAREQGITAGDYVVLSVRDNGKGISREDLEHIFEPFYSRKIMGRSGTGLGLAVVWNSVMDHGGAVLVDSSPKGTCFELYFPASDQDLPVAERQPDEEELKGAGETVLVVDDEAQQRDIAGRMLRVLGYRVAVVESGEKAIDYLRENRVDLVLLDMLMDPGINGRQTYETIVHLHPGQKAVIASGFSENEEISRAQQLGAQGFIKKPYSLAQLGKAVKEELAR